MTTFHDGTVICVNCGRRQGWDGHMYGICSRQWQVEVLLHSARSADALGAELRQPFPEAWSVTDYSAERVTDGIVSILFWLQGAGSDDAVAVEVGRHTRRLGAAYDVIVHAARQPVAVARG